MMPVVIANPTTRAHHNLLAKDKIRLRDPATGRLLHMSGKGTVPDINNSWLGYRYQAENLAQRAEIRGEDWPFKPVHRDLLERVREVDE